MLLEYPLAQLLMFSYVGAILLLFSGIFLCSAAIAHILSKTAEKIFAFLARGTFGLFMLIAISHALFVLWRVLEVALWG